jgi:hypothetical protein
MRKPGRKNEPRPPVSTRYREWITSLGGELLLELASAVDRTGLKNLDSGSTYRIKLELEKFLGRPLPPPTIALDDFEDWEWLMDGRALRELLPSGYSRVKEALRQELERARGIRR